MSSRRKNVVHVRWGSGTVVAELVAESAQSLAVAASRMQAALAAYAACPEAAPEREAALFDAAEATHAYVIQREAMGFHETAAALDLLGVPDAVRALLGVRRPRALERPREPDRARVRRLMVRARKPGE